MATQAIPFTIRHWDSENYPNATVSGRIEIYDEYIALLFDGYGTKGAASNYGPLVVIEVDGDESAPRAIVWADITQEDPTHIAPLAGAADRLLPTSGGAPESSPGGVIRDGPPSS